MIGLLRALLFNIAFYIDTVVMGVLALPFLLMPRRTCMRFGRFWAQTVLFLVKWTVGLDSEIRGRGNIPPGGCLIAMKHQSMWDTLILPPLLGDPAVVIKRELQFVPFYGWYAARSGSIFIDRKGGAGALRRMIGAAKQAIAMGRPVVIFPQGTRTGPVSLSRKCHTSPGSRRSIANSRCRWCRRRSIPDSIGGGAPSLSAQGASSWSFCRRFRPACRGAR